ncbi:MAG TPA: phosphate ABC transporter permease PstA [Leptospiraceae bacterium]|nr:phosphate ABC transporter permease PstA [Leptospirales bacterium]HMU82697.1 phosphate ABC transporter permease PstA [Leptospiraceae bacterium]HMX57039.1 phosphate ABC transporter permease PstA [Leptospiraceae bacterium]HMY46862.1 phosphate ABC transporter permease PstA [Leptospiraceae bacterium]HMZ35522.1 phosphate ABC transporter permease PstA [Leptospiraceae bacterium]
MKDLRVRYRIYGAIFEGFCFSANVLAFGFLLYLLGSVLFQGVPNINWTFLTEYPSRFPQKAGILAAIAGTVWMMVLTAFVSIPLGIGAAIYLEEYARPGRLVNLVRLNIQNLAGVPSIIYGMLGLTMIVRGLGLGRSILAGALTMALLILPVITIATQEALRAVPGSLRLAGFGIGMTRWQVVRYQVFPSALPGIMTGIILALSRAVGESAPLLLVGATAYSAYLPSSPMDGFTVLSVQIYNWIDQPQKEFQALAAGAIVILLVLLIALNSIAIYLRQYYRKKVSTG